MKRWFSTFSWLQLVVIASFLWQLFCFSVSFGVPQNNSSGKRCNSYPNHLLLLPAFYLLLARRWGTYAFSKVTPTKMKCFYHSLGTRSGLTLHAISLWHSFPPKPVRLEQLCWDWVIPSKLISKGEGLGVRINWCDHSALQFLSGCTELCADMTSGTSYLFRK